MEWVDELVTEFTSGAVRVQNQNGRIYDDDGNDDGDDDNNNNDDDDELSLRVR